MTLISCPQCSKTVSSIASRCPNCGTQLAQLRFMQGQEGTLTECRKCSRKVLSAARECPYCGIARPGRRTLSYGIAALLIAVAVPMFVLMRSEGKLSIRAEAAPPRGAVVPPPDAPALAKPSVVAEASVATNPDQDAGTPTARGPAMDDASARQESASALRSLSLVSVTPAPRRAMWTNNWANVRVGRALDSDVVLVLKPGEEIEVTDRQQGWWAAYVNGSFQGYVAGSLLNPRPPSQAAPDTGAVIGTARDEHR